MDKARRHMQRMSWGGGGLEGRQEEQAGKCLKGAACVRIISLLMGTS